MSVIRRGICNSNINLSIASSSKLVIVNNSTKVPHFNKNIFNYIYYKKSRFSTSSRINASIRAEEDFYKRLEVEKNATQQDIKLQFYKLSKKWHPDVNQGSEESKIRFQEVSEAYATLGNESSRKQYDRQRSSVGFGARRGGSGGGGGGGMMYNSDNLQRRATATYAWDYQKRNAARAFKRANSASASASSAGGYNNQQQQQQNDFGSGGYRTHYQHDGNAAFTSQQKDKSLFERLAEQQRKREAAMQARSEGQQQTSSNQTRTDSISDQGSSHTVRFLQVTGLFGFIFYFSTFFLDGGSDGRTATRKRVLSAKTG